MQLTDSPLGISLAVEPDHAGAALLHFSVLHVAAAGEQLPQVLKRDKQKSETDVHNGQFCHTHSSENTMVRKW